MAEISCKNLSLGYDGKAVAENIDFTVNGGDYLCILGENGAGKSTLMKTVLSLQEPLSGEIKYGDGLKTTEIGYIPQRTDAQKDFPATVYEIVLSGCLSGLGFCPFYTKKQKETALENMELLGLSGFSKRCFACKGALFHEKDASSGRTGRGARSHCDERAVRNDR